MDSQASPRSGLRGWLKFAIASFSIGSPTLCRAVRRSAPRAPLASPSSPPPAEVLPAGPAEDRAVPLRSNLPAHPGNASGCPPRPVVRARSQAAAGSGLPWRCLPIARGKHGCRSGLRFSGVLPGGSTVPRGRPGRRPAAASRAAPSRARERHSRFLAVRSGRCWAPLRKCPPTRRRFAPPPHSTGERSSPLPSLHTSSALERPVPDLRLRYRSLVERRLLLLYGRGSSSPLRGRLTNCLLYAGQGSNLFSTAVLPSSPTHGPKRTEDCSKRSKPFRFKTLQTGGAAAKGSVWLRSRS